MAGASTVSSQSLPVASHQPVSWQRLVLLVALLNAPLYFNGCDANETRFSAGTAIPFAEMATQKQQPLGPTTPVAITWWSWWRCAANFLVMGAAIWLACRYVAWIACVGESRWFVATLVLVALVFNSWLCVPHVWPHLVFMPTLELSMYLQSLVTEEGPNDAIYRYVLPISARLYYFACVIGVGGVTFGLQVFFRRYFFVQAGHWWQVQLGGLITVVLVLGTAIGIVARLLMQQQ